jgi:xylan 1,4-beta-xylosidase
MLVQQTKGLNYSLTTNVDVKKTGDNTSAGIALVGAAHNGFAAPLAAVGLSANTDGIRIWRNKASQKETLFYEPMDLPSDVTLIMNVKKGHLITFIYQTSDGELININKEVDVSSLVPWGMGFRYGLVAEGPEDEYGVFKDFSLEHQ